ncbi:MAG TPA: hypothetical protein VKD72_13475 [Gemmataceae bacterium]|nr:hypothetical protein [Gemmataceae bacterium]
MATSAKRLFVAVLAGLALLAPAVSSVQAQVNPLWRVQVGPTFVPLNQLAFNISTYGRAMSQVPPWVAGYNPYPQAVNYGPVYNPMIGGGSLYNNSPGLYGNSLYNNPYNYGGGYGGYGSGYSPYYGYGGYGDYNPLGYTLQGAASAIQAQGQFNITNQQAKLIQQQVEQQKVETRRKIYDEWLYEQANTKSLEDRRQEMLKYELRRAMTQPPLPEILNGSSLDSVYKDLLGKQPLWSKGPQLTIDEGVLKHINLTTKSGGNAGLLKRVKEGEELPWPASMKSDAYRTELGRLNRALAEAVKLAEAKGSVDAGMIQNMRDDVRALQAKLTSNINDLTPSDSITAKRFLAQLEDALTALQQPDIADQLTGRFAAKGKTVGELLQYMSSKGLTFGPAVNGDEAAYVAMLNYLVGYNSALGNVSSGGTGQ